MLFSGKNKHSGLNANTVHDKQGLSVEEQLLLFQTMETNSRQVQEQAEEADRVKDSVARIRSVIFIQPELDHNCSTTYCSPVNESTLIAHHILGGTPVHPDVFVCRYGRYHVCNSRYRECVIVMDNTQQCTCRITGRFYGLNGSWQIGGGGGRSLAAVTAEYSADDEGNNHIDDESSILAAEKSSFAFDDYALDGLDMGGDCSDGEGENNNNGGANSYHPFNPPSAFNQVMHTTNSKFISRAVDANAPIESAAHHHHYHQQHTAAVIGGGMWPPTTTSTTTTTTTMTTVVTKKRDVRATIIQTSSSGGRPSKRARSLVSPPAPLRLPIPPPAAPLLRSVTPDQLAAVIKAEYMKRREDIQEIINCLFYSAKRTQIGNLELRNCMDTAKKAVSGTIRTIRDKQLKRLPVVIPLYDIMVTYYTHITVAHTLLTIAPQNPTFIEQVINIIMFLWRRVVKFHLVHNIPYIKQTFVQHCLAVFYEMRKGGRILRDSEIIPDSTYIRMYMPSIELIEQFGYKKNFITLGFKMLLQAYKELT